MYQALYRKWRPRRFDDVVGQEHITETLKRQVETGRLSHAYLFTGTRGTGKTSCAKILAKAINCEQPEGGNPCNRCPSCLGIDSGAILDVLELDAASNNGVDQVRALREEAIYTPAAVKSRVYIIDEVHMLSTPAFNALLKILEEPPPHLLFILATTELHKVPATIKSRCQQFSFKRILPAEIMARLQFVAQQEGFALSDTAAQLLARLAEGGLRDALSLLDQCGGGAVEETTVLQVLGLSGNLEMTRLLEQIVVRDTAAALAHIAALHRDGKDMSALLSELSTLLRDLLIRKTAPQGGDALLSGGYDEGVLHSFAGQFTAEQLFSMLSLLQTAASELYRSSNRRTDVELCIVKLCRQDLSATPEALLARISHLEQQLAQGTLLAATQPPPLLVAAPPVTQRPQAEAAVPMTPVHNTPQPSKDVVLPWDEMLPVLDDIPPPWDDVPPPLKDTEPPWDNASPPLQDTPAPSWIEVPVSEGKTSPHTTPTVPTGQTPEPDAVLPTATALSTPASLSVAGAGEEWKPFVTALRGKLTPSAYAFLAKPAFAMGVFGTQSLILYLDSEMTKSILSKASVQEALLREAEAYTGRKVTIQLCIGKAPKETPVLHTSSRLQPVPQPPSEEEHADLLGDLLKLGQQFGNITIQ